MACRFINVTMVRAVPGSSVVGLSAYVSRSARVDTQDQRYDFRHRADEIVAHGLILPDGSPEWAHDPAQLWRQAERAEMTIDRKTGEHRFKINAQFARHLTICLPRELTDQQREEMLADFVRTEVRPEKFAVAVEWAIHRDPSNPHAHVLISTRSLGPSGFGKKCREMNPQFGTRKGQHFVAEDQEWSDRWTRFQADWCRRRDIDIKIRPKGEVAEPSMAGQDHKSPFVEKKIADIREHNDLVRQAEALDPRTALDRLTEQRSVFTLKEMRALFRSAKITDQDEQKLLEERILAHPDVLTLADDRGVAVGWTTRQVRAEEEASIKAATIMAAESGAPDPYHVDPRNFYRPSGLTREQMQAALKLVTTSRLALMVGRAGTGKSTVLNAVRRAYEKAGWQVVGLSPTNTVAEDLKADGFAVGQTLHKHLSAFEEGRVAWDAKTVVIVDEAAMADTQTVFRLFRAAWKTKAKLVLAGDPAQFESISRGGMFAELARRHSPAVLRTVMRQKTEWQARASENYAAGDVRAALEAYEARGQIVWTDTVEEAERLAAENEGFLHASTNRSVDRLNVSAQKRHRAQTGIRSGVTFQTTRRSETISVNLAAGERVQIYKSASKSGLFTGQFGTAISVSQHAISVRLDNGHVATFDPRHFKAWGLGWAGTAYKGQGKTVPRTSVVYDSRYGFNARAAYVTGTRHRDDTQIFVPRQLAKNVEELIAQIEMQRGERPASVRYTAYRPQPRPQPQQPRPQAQPQQPQQPQPQPQPVTGTRPTGYTPGIN